VTCDDWLVVSVFLVAGILVAVKVDECGRDEPTDTISHDFGVE
jgi:hypothetical protein